MINPFRKTIIAVVVGVLCMAGTPAFAATSKSSATKIKTVTAKTVTAKPLEKLFYYVPGFATFNSFEAHAKNVDVFAPQVYGVDEAGTLAGSISDTAWQVIRDNKTRVMPLVANKDFDQDIMHTFLQSSAAQTKAADALVAEALAKGYIGWQFDFEHILATDRDSYSSFVELAATKLHAKKLLLSVSVVSRTSDNSADLPAGSWDNWAGVYDYARIGKAADFVSLMAYDEPASKGSVASLPWVKKVLAYAEKNIKKSKLSLGISVYGWLWNADTGKRIQSVPYSKVADLIANKKYTQKGFDATAQAAWLTYSDGVGASRKNYKIWYEDVRSWKPKLALAKSHGLRGISVWVLGMEDEAIWKNLK